VDHCNCEEKEGNGYLLGTALGCFFDCTAAEDNSPCSGGCVGFTGKILLFLGLYNAMFALDLIDSLVPNTIGTAG
jgi:hypothetical protein